jgi:SAM-dependent methyltransferase
VRASGAVGAVGEYISYLDELGEILEAPKKASIKALALKPGDAALDVGCGTGNDVRLLAEAVGPAGRAVGIDANPAMIAEAKGRTLACPQVEFVVSDAAAMPFGNDEFAAARVERALQHMEDPAAAVAEMARVVRPGGRLVAMEPDWDTLAISAADLEMTRAVVRMSAGRFRRPDAGRRLPEWFALAGVEILRVEAAAVPIRSVDAAVEVFQLTPVARAGRRCLARGPAGARDAQRVRRVFDRIRRGWASGLGLGGGGPVGAKQYADSPQRARLNRPP